MANIDRVEIDKAIENYLSKIILSSAQHKRANQSIDALTGLFNSRTSGIPIDKTVYTQGSFSTRTTVQPKIDIDESDEFDVDLVVESSSWQSANQALTLIKEVLSQSNAGQSISSRKSCIRVQYSDGPAGEKFHIDVTPILLDNDGRRWVALFGENEGKWKESYPQKLTDWFNERNDQHPTFRSVYLILKRLAQINDVDVPSIVLQSLMQDSYTFKAGNHYTRELLELLRSIAGNLSDPRYQLRNPVNSTEDLRDRVSDDTLSQLKLLADNSSKRIAEFSMNGNNTILVDLFGYGFPSSVPHIKELSLRSAEVYFDCDFTREHIVKASCSKGKIEGGTYVIEVPGDFKNDPLERKTLDNIKFYVGSTELKNRNVLWQVMNDPEEVAFQIRGKFEESNSEDPKESRRESVNWAGEHWVRAYLIIKNRCYSISKKFRVDVVRK